MQRYNNTNVHDNRNGSIRSKQISGFMQSHPTLSNAVVSLLDQVFMHPSRSPYESGCNGVVLTADRPRFNKNALLNIEKPTYLRQSFAKSYDTCGGTSPINTGTRLCTTYGTGSGFLTHGTPKSQLVFRDYNPEIEYICNIIRREMIDQFHNDADVFRRS